MGGCVENGNGVREAGRFDVDALVIGAGPIGLVIANLLGRYGISTLVAERNSGLADMPRAVALDDEGMRTLQMAGLVEAAAPHMLLGYDHRLFGRNGRLLLSVDPASREHGYPKRNRFHQPILEEILLAGVDRFPGVDIAFGHELTAFEGDADGVTARFALAEGGERALRARILIGADGGNSAVRRMAGLRMDGESHAEPWIVIDTEANDDTARYSRAIGDPSRPTVNVPGVEGRRRYEFMLLPGEDPEAAASDAAVAKLLAPFCDLDRVRVTRRTVYTFHSLIAERFSQGRRIFLAGDAAHMMPPFQGQGMNSGMRDASLLAWRVAAVLRGQLGAGLLDSYDAERRPHAREMMLLSQRVGRILMTRSPVRALLRDMMFGVLTRLPGTGRYLREMRFKPQPDAASGFFAGPADGIAGKLFPQPDILTIDGRRVPLDSVLRDGFAILHLTDAPFDPRPAFGHPFWARIAPTHLLVLPGGLTRTPEGIAQVADIGGSVRAAAGGRRGIALLLRPDRYLAAVIEQGRADEVATALEALADGGDTTG